MHISPIKTDAWKHLEISRKRLEKTRIRSLFNIEKNRLQEFSIIHENIYFDFSKNLIDSSTLACLVQLAQEVNLKKNINKLFNGEPINETEDRPVLHTALRKFDQHDLKVHGESVFKLVQHELRRINVFCDNIHSGSWKGYNGKKIKYIINIGIGGSDLGPQFVVDALKQYHIEDIQTFFVSNVDGSHLTETIKKVNIEETLFLIVSKTFTTQETMANFHLAKDVFLQHAKNEKYISNHFIAISSNVKEVNKYAIPIQNIFSFWDWVGGRFSLWSSVGISIALTIGYENFVQLLKGANNIDKHFKKSPFEKNIPIILALVSLWNRNFQNLPIETILPYSQDLRLLPCYLQQASMESNGKQIDRNGNFVEYDTSPVLWGDAGTNAQHSFFQAIHQGTQKIPSDFIAFKTPNHSYIDSHYKLLANCFAQSEAMMNGKLHDKGFNLEDFKELDKIEKYKTFIGNIPTNTFLFEKLNPYSLGQLIAIYEHKIFTLGILWNIYSFDQWGVELGKVLAKEILEEFKNGITTISHDPSTEFLIQKISSHK